MSPTPLTDDLMPFKRLGTVRCFTTWRGSCYNKESWSVCDVRDGVCKRKISLSDLTRDFTRSDRVKCHEQDTSPHVIALAPSRQGIQCKIWLVAHSKCLFPVMSEQCHCESSLVFSRDSVRGPSRHKDDDRSKNSFELAPVPNPRSDL